MTLDEQITILEHNAEHERTHGDLQGCLDFRQLVAWLKDYKLRLLEKKPGRWIHVRCDMYECSVCGRLHTSFELGRCDAKYCPNCGERLEEGE